MPVWVTYSHTDDREREKLFSYFRGSPFNLMYDGNIDQNLGYWQDQILPAIARAGCFIYLISDASQQSDICKSEYEYFRRLDTGYNVIFILVKRVQNVYNFVKKPTYVDCSMGFSGKNTSQIWTKLYNAQDVWQENPYRGQMPGFTAASYVDSIIDSVFVHHNHNAAHELYEGLTRLRLSQGDHLDSRVNLHRLSTEIYECQEQADEQRENNERAADKYKKILALLTSRSAANRERGELMLDKFFGRYPNFDPCGLRRDTESDTSVLRKGRVQWGALVPPHSFRYVSDNRIRTAETEYGYTASRFTATQRRMKAFVLSRDYTDVSVWEETQLRIHQQMLNSGIDVDTYFNPRDIMADVSIVRGYSEETGDHPATSIRYIDAVAFAVTLSRYLQADIYIPSEVEWMRLLDGQSQFCWERKHNNNIKDPTLLTCQVNSNGRTSPVDSHLRGMGPFGQHHLHGNVWEMTSTMQVVNSRVCIYAKGGSCQTPIDSTDMNHRQIFSITDRDAFLGFRVCMRVEAGYESYLPTVEDLLTAVP